MPRTVTPLNDKEIKALKPKDKAYTKPDGKGLHLLIKPDGSKLWEFIFTSPTLSKRRKTSFGTYPNTTLSDARDKRDDYSKKIKVGIDPIDENRRIKDDKKQDEIKNENTFEKLARERLLKVQDTVSEAHYKRTLTAFINDCFPYIGDMPINDITAKELLVILQEMNQRGANESGRKLFYAIGKTFKWAVANQLAERNPAADILLEEVLGKNTRQNYPTIIDDDGIRGLLLAIDSYTGEHTTKRALQLQAHTFIRPYNIRHAQWSEIDLNNKQWTIPAKKMKTKEDLIVPLSDTVISIFEDMQQFTSDSPYIFHSPKSKTSPMSDNTLLGAIRRLGYTKEEFVPHGFRAMFSTLAHEKSNFKHEVIETQLAHSVGNSVSQAYNRAKYLDERVELMSWWSDYLDKLFDSKVSTCQN
jgi:integrase